MTHAHAHSKGGEGHYVRLLIMSILSFIAMYILMYAMVDKFADVYSNWNQVYMAALMTAPMVVFELVLMSSMYQRRTLNLLIILGCIVLLALAWSAIRFQWGITDAQFLRSMIPHHSGAILMCQETSLGDAEIKSLCDKIIAGQQSEIDQMNAKLTSLK
jgi:uncharacterized protein (DUF305 family)